MRPRSTTAPDRPPPGRRAARSLVLLAAAFAGGAAAAELAHAGAQPASPYALFDQLARVLVLVENQYVEPADRTRIVEGAIKGMVAELDPHSAYLPPREYADFQTETEGRFGGVGLEVDQRDEVVTVIAPIDGSPAARAGMRPGDVIVAIDGRATRGERLAKLVEWMRGAPGSRVKVSVRRKGAPEVLTFELTREVIHVPSVVARRLDGEVAFLRIKQFQEGTLDELLRAAGRLRAERAAPLTGILVDLRNNPGGLVDQARGVADEFLVDGLIYSTRHRGQVIEEAHARPGGAFLELPVVVLVNEYSASSSELLAGALQDNRRATLVGAATFGKGSVQTIFDLPGGGGLKLTTMRYYTPNGRSIQAQGIVPDVTVEPPRPDGAIGVTRERDLEGHLPAEGGERAPAPARVGASPGATSAAGEAPEEPGKHDHGVAREIPANPSRGTDQALRIGYELLLRAAPSGAGARR